MYINILIPTDGSKLAGEAVQHGIALAKRIGAKATVLTVLTPFHTFTIDTQMIEDTSAQYKVRMKEHAEKTLGAAARAARTAWVQSRPAPSGPAAPDRERRQSFPARESAGGSPSRPAPSLRPAFRPHSTVPGCAGCRPPGAPFRAGAGLPVLWALRASAILSPPKRRWVQSPNGERRSASPPDPAAR